MTMEPSREYVREYLQASEETLQEAKTLLARRFPKGAASRAYYAMFYAVQAALALVNVRKPKTHSGAITLFGQHYVVTGKIDKRFAGDLRDAYDLRQRSDYEIRAHIGEDEVRETVRRAEGFVSEVKRVVGFE